MDSRDIFNLIEAIAATSSKNEKQALIAQNSNDEDFLRVLKAAYDPTITYGVQTLPAREAGGGGLFDRKTLELLNSLASRKLSGNDALAEIQRETNRLEPGSSALLHRILKKDLRAGFSESTINKAIKGLIPEYPYMRCSLPKHVGGIEAFVTAPTISQEKADGMFVNCLVDTHGNVEISTRQGTLVPTAAPEVIAIINELKKFEKGTVTHGEFLIVLDGQVLPREIGNGMLNSICKGGALTGTHKIILKVWDQIPHASATPGGVCSIPYARRLKSLIEQAKGGINRDLIDVIDTRVVSTPEEAYAHYSEMLAKGKEGTVLKKPSAIWKDHTSKEQIKLKLEVVVDLEIVGFTPGEGKNLSTFGSITCRTSDGLLEVNVSGMNDATRKKISDNRAEYVGKILAVKANEIMVSKDGGKHSLFLPVFVEAREDKVLADSYLSVVDQFESAKKGGKA